MKLTRSLCVAIVEVVSKDKEAKKRIDSFLSTVMPDGLGWTGSARNYGFALKETFFGNGNPTKEQELLICYGIAEYTAKILNIAISKVKAGSTLSIIEKVSYINRDLHGIAHQATLFKLLNGTEFVFDWHATLSSKNPLIYRTVKDFEEGTNSVMFENFVDSR